MKKIKLDKFVDAFDTFLWVRDCRSVGGTHIHDCIDMKRTMIMVVLALVPCVLFGMYNVGYQHYLAAGIQAGFWETFWYGFLKVLPMYVVSYAVGLGIEFTVAQVRGHEVSEGYLVTGILIPCIMPVNLPLWMLALAVVFAVVIGKEVMGGSGMNIWNPALLARAFVFFAYPSHMTGDSAWVADAVSGATPLSQMAGGHLPLASLSDMFWGFIPGSIGETSTFCVLLGALVLIGTGTASWKVMLSCTVGAVLMCLISGQALAYHLVAGGFAFGCVFMATDPVTGAQTEIGKWIYGFLIGVMVMLIRFFNPGYPEGMMLSILLLNTFAPLIDHLVVEANIRRRNKRIVCHE